MSGNCTRPEEQISGCPKYPEGKISQGEIPVSDKQDIRTTMDYYRCMTAKQKVWCSRLLAPSKLHELELTVTADGEKAWEYRAQTEP